MNRTFDRTFHYFRAFAIFSVLGAHVWFSPEVEGLENERQVLECLRSVLFHSSTLYFIFISGYLFDYIYQTREFRLRDFYLSKVKNVLCPYLVLSTILIAASLLLCTLSVPVPAFINFGSAPAGSKEVALSYLLGTACVTYWYIPFIMLVYLVSPVLFRIRGQIFALLTLAAAFVPLFVPRDDLADFYRNFCFFYPTFLLGVFFSRHREACVGFLKDHWKALALIALGTSLALCSEFYHQRLASVETAYYVQRLAIGGLVITALESLSFESLFMDLMARYSFPLYFLHDMVSAATRDSLHALFLRASPNGLVFTTMVTFAVEIALCMGLVWFIKRVTGGYSRRIIGG
ncbi:MAG: acyltransferase [Desulfovibrionaceae bacterium]|nr:acyltransferase [Desulfovibrionaceae bacterium]